MSARAVLVHTIHKHRQTVGADLIANAEVEHRLACGGRDNLLLVGVGNSVGVDAGDVVVGGNQDVVGVLEHELVDQTVGDPNLAAAGYTASSIQHDGVCPGDVALRRGVAGLRRCGARSVGKNLAAGQHRAAVGEELGRNAADG